MTASKCVFRVVAFGFVIFSETNLAFLIHTSANHPSIRKAPNHIQDCAQAFKSSCARISRKVITRRVSTIVLFAETRLWERWLDVRDTKLNPKEAVNIVREQLSFNSSMLRIDRVLLNPKIVEDFSKRSDTTTLDDPFLYVEPTDDLLVAFTKTQSIPIGKRLFPVLNERKTVGTIDPIQALQIRQELGWVFVDQENNSGVSQQFNIEPLLDILSVASKVSSDDALDSLWIPSSMTTSSDDSSDGGLAVVCSSQESLFAATAAVMTSASTASSSDSSAILIPQQQQAGSSSLVKVALVLPLDLQLWGRLLELEEAVSMESSSNFEQQ